MISTANELLVMSRVELDELYRGADSGPIPDGDTAGIAIIAAGTALTGPSARLVHSLMWRGKVFDGHQGTLINKVTAFSIPAVKAKVYRGLSWFDAREAIILDYSETSFIARSIRDEIRQVAPGVYLGRVYWGKTRVCDFALTFGNVAIVAPE